VFRREAVQTGMDTRRAIKEPARGLEGIAGMGLARQAQGARRKSMPGRIVDDEQRRDCPQSPCAQKVPAARGHLLRCRASTMHKDIAFGAASCIWPRGARNAISFNPRTGSLGPAGILDSMSRSPTERNAVDMPGSTAVAEGR